MKPNKIYRCRRCYTPLSIPMRFAYKDIDKEDDWLRASGEVNADYLCLNCQIEQSGIPLGEKK